MRRLILCISVFGLMPFLFVQHSIGKEVWVKAEGSAVIAGITGEEAQLLALQRARAAAIERASGVRISSTTLVRDAQLAGEFIKSFSRAFIVEEKPEWSSIKIQESPSSPPIMGYRVELKARVYVPEREASWNCSLEAQLNKTEFSDGEEVTLKIKTDRDAYIAIFNLMGDDRFVLLFPNHFISNNLVKAGQWFRFPPKDCGISLTMKTLRDHKQDTEAIFIVGFDKSVGKSIDFCTIFPPSKAFKTPDFFSKYTALPLDHATEKILVYRVKKQEEAHF